MHSNGMYELLHLPLLSASYTWYEVQRLVFGRCVGREKVVVARSPVVHRLHTYTVTTGTKAGVWHTAAVVLLLLYCCILMLWLRGGATGFVKMDPPLFSITYTLHKYMSGTHRSAHTYTYSRTYTQKHHL